MTFLLGGRFTNDCSHGCAFELGSVAEVAQNGG
jgi:hypothetical protein